MIKRFVIRWLEKILKLISYQIESIDFELQFNKDMDNSELESFLSSRRKFIELRMHFYETIECLKREEWLK